MSLHEAHSTGGDHTLQHACEQEDTGQEEKVVCLRLAQIGRAYIQWVISKTDYTEQYRYFK